MSGSISSNFSEKKSRFIAEAPPGAPAIMLVRPDSSGENWFFSRSNLVRPEQMETIIFAKKLKTQTAKSNRIRQSILGPLKLKKTLLELLLIKIKININ
jgi:hypothetical protein